MKFHATRCMLAGTACTLLFLLAPDSANAFGGHLIGRQPTTAYFVPQPMVPAPAAPTVAYAPMMVLPAAQATAYYSPSVAAPAPVPVMSYYAPAAYYFPVAPVGAPVPTTTFYATPTVAPATVVYYPVWLPRRRVSPIHGY